MLRKLMIIHTHRWFKWSRSFNCNGCFRIGFLNSFFEAVTQFVSVTYYQDVAISIFKCRYNSGIAVFILSCAD